MKKTQKSLALVLTLALVLSALFTLVACQTTCDKEGHKFEKGICSVCGEACAHPDGYDELGRCKVCGTFKPVADLVDGDYWVRDEKKYSYRMAPSDLPTSWNLHTYQSASSTYILDYTSDSLYGFDYNEAGDAYVIVPEMAEDYPVDVSADYVGKYGIAEGEENKAYSITLKQGLRFDNGDPITAETFVESMKLLLAPEAANYRADNVYKSGNLKIYGSENYVKQGSYALLNPIVSEDYLDEEYIDPAKFTAGPDGTLQYEGKDLALDLNSGGSWSSNSLLDYGDAGYYGAGYDYAEDGYIQYVDATGAVRVVRKVGEDGAPTAEYFLPDRTTVVYRGTQYDFYYDEAHTQPIEGCEALSAKWQYGVAQPLFDAADEKGWVKLNAELMTVLQETIAALHGVTLEQYAAACEAAGKLINGVNYAYLECQEMAYFAKEMDAYSWDDVGFFAPSEYELVVVLKNAMEDNFYLRYELCTNFFLVHPETYKSCIDMSSGLYTNNYGTSIDTFVGYGPYKLTTYLADSKIELTRNEYWRGYYEIEKQGQYQTTHVVYNKVNDEATRLAMFLKGELESYGLTDADMADYINSDYLYYNNSESTWFLAMNPDFKTLEANQKTATPVTPDNTVVKTILDIKEFRQALSYSLDREAFNLELSPTSGVAKALLSEMFIADPESGSFYRTTDEAKDAILNFWGLADQWGEGKKYEDRDAAIDSITGFDPEGAKVLFQAAYDKAVERGDITAEMISSGKWELQICIGKPADASYYNKGYEFLAKCWTDAVKGTDFEGHLSFIQSQVLGSTSFGTYLRNGSVDILFGVGYSGSMFDPFSFMDVFTGSLQYDPFTDKTQHTLDIEIDGQVLRASLYDWTSVCLQGDEIECPVIGADGEPTGQKVKISAGVDAPAKRRLLILSSVETAIMELANIFPIQTDATASLRCMRVQYKTEEYILGLGRGGITYYTYAMDDEAWAKYVQEQGGELDYK